MSNLQAKMLCTYMDVNFNNFFDTSNFQQHYTSRAVLVDTIVCKARDASDENEREEDERNVN